MPVDTPRKLLNDLGEDVDGSKETLIARLIDKQPWRTYFSFNIYLSELQQIEGSNPILPLTSYGTHYIVIFKYPCSQTWLIFGRLSWS